jgi:hypothetical protein
VELAAISTAARTVHLMEYDIYLDLWLYSGMLLHCYLNDKKMHGVRASTSEVQHCQAQAAQPVSKGFSLPERYCIVGLVSTQQ